MSYSFSVRALDKAALEAAVATEFAKVVEQQPVHAADKEAALAAIGLFLDLLPSDGELYT